MPHVMREFLFTNSKSEKFIGLFPIGLKYHVDDDEMHVVAENVRSYEYDKFDTTRGLSQESVVQQFLEDVDADEHVRVQLGPSFWRPEPTVTITHEDGFTVVLRDVSNVGRVTDPYFLHFELSKWNYSVEPAMTHDQVGAKIFDGGWEADI